DAHTASQRAYLDWSTHFAVRHAARLIAVSQATKNDLVKLYQADEQQVTVVHHGVEALPTARPEGPRANAATVLATLPPRYILAIGTIQPRKNYARLIE